LNALHPSTKLTLAFALVVIALAARWILMPIALFLLVILPLAAWGRLARKLLRATFVVILPFAISLGLVQGLFYPGAENVVLRLGPLSLKSEGLLFAFATATRILVLAGAGLLVLYSTHPADLALALVQRGAPPSLAYIAVAVVQLLPEMQARATAIMDAQRARGLETEGSLPTRLRAFLPLVGPLIYGALENVQGRALALESRAFRAPRRKTSWRELHDSKAQQIIRTLLLGITLLVVVVGILS
jgi:energy-coupling factor transport system permease protein